MKGIVVAGGEAKRLFPLTKSLSKHLLPVYDKPMIYYPLSVLMLADIKDIMIITNKQHTELYKNLLGNGENFGINLCYGEQEQPNGIAESLLIAEEFLDGDNVCLILGDNIFFGYSFSEILKNKSRLESGAEIFAYAVNNPENYGIVEFDENKNVISLEEKPVLPKSKFAVTGLYFYDATVVQKAKTLSKSARGEFEITDINNMYLAEKKLNLNILGRGFSWFDAGNEKSLLQASNFVESVQERQGNYIACLEEIALQKKWMDKRKLENIIKTFEKTKYGDYLKKIMEEV